MCLAQQKAIRFLDWKTQKSEGNRIFIKKMRRKMSSVFNKSFLTVLQYSHFKPVVELYCRIAGATETNFPVQCAFKFKQLPNSVHSWKKCAHLFYFQNCNNPLVSHIFLSKPSNAVFLIFHQGVVLIFLEIIYNTWLYYVIIPVI